MSLVLRTLTENDERAFLIGLQDWKSEDLDWYTFDWAGSYTDMLTKLANKSLGIDLPHGFVPSTMFYGFVNDVIVGRLHVRHSLNNYLLNHGGNIGYAVAEKYRGKGYASEMMRQVLPFCKHIGLSKLLLTCDDNNVPSYKIIEKMGGVLENKVKDEQLNRITRRYWISF